VRCASNRKYECESRRFALLGLGVGVRGGKADFHALKPVAENPVFRELFGRPRNCIHNLYAGALKRSFELRYRLELYGEDALPRAF
jgi:hypothetical protein